MDRILFIHHSVGWGGAPINMINIIKSIKSKEFQAIVLLLKDSVVSKHLQTEGIPFVVTKNLFYKHIYKYFNHTIPGYTKWYRLFKLTYLTINWLLSRYIFAPFVLKRFDYDIVHLNSSVLTDWLAPCNAKGKVILHVQEPFSNGHFGIRSKFFRYQMQKYADGIITVSYDNYNRIKIPDKTYVIYNFTEHQDEKPKAFSYRNKKFLYVGGASYIKGFQLLCEALIYINDDVEIYFLGDYPSLNPHNLLKHIIKILICPRYRLQRKSLKIMKSSHIAHEIGLVKDIYKYLNKACCLVSPFKIPHFSRPIIEAFSCSKPVIATNLPGTDEIVTNEINGILVAPKPQDLAYAINQISTKPDLCMEMGKNAFQIAAEKFSRDNILMYRKVYKAIMNN